MTGVQTCALPIFYQDFFRWSQWEKADPTSYNFDWYQGSGNLFGGAIETSLPANSDYRKQRIVTGKQIGRASCRERVCQYV